MSLLCFLAFSDASDRSNCASDVSEAPASSLFQSAFAQKPLRAEEAQGGSADVDASVTNYSFAVKANTTGNESTASNVTTTKSIQDPEGSSSVQAADESLEKFSHHASQAKALVRQVSERTKERLAAKRASYQKNLTQQEERNAAQRSHVHAIQKVVLQQAAANRKLKLKTLAKHEVNQAARKLFVTMKPKVDHLLALATLNAKVSLVDYSSPELVALSRQDAVTAHGPLRDYMPPSSGLGLLQFKNQLTPAVSELDDVAEQITSAVEERVDAIAEAERKSIAVLEAKFKAQWEAAISEHVDLTKQIEDLNAKATTMRQRGTLLKKTFSDVTRMGTDMKDYVNGLRSFASNVSSATSQYVAPVALLELVAAGEGDKKTHNVPAGVGLAKVSTKTRSKERKDASVTEHKTANASKFASAFSGPLMDMPEYDSLLYEMVDSSKDFQEYIDSMQNAVAEQWKAARKLLMDLETNFSTNLSAMDGLAKQAEDKVIEIKANITDTHNKTDKVRQECETLIAKIGDIHGTFHKLQPSMQAAAKFFAEMLSATSNDNSSVMAVLSSGDNTSAKDATALLQFRAGTNDKRELPVSRTVTNLSDVVVTLRRMDLETETRKQEIVDKFRGEVYVRNKRAQTLADEQLSFEAELKAAVVRMKLTLVAKRSLSRRLKDYRDALEQMHGFGVEALEAADMTLSLFNGSVNSSGQTNNISFTVEEEDHSGNWISWWSR